MTWLIALNKILDIKVVQYALLALVVGLLSLNIWTQIKYNSLRLEHALLESNYAKLDTATQIQNARIAEAGRVYEEQAKNLEQAQRRATEIAKINKDALAKLNKFSFVPNSTCDEKVQAVFLQLSSVRHHK